VPAFGLGSFGLGLALIQAAMLACLFCGFGALLFLAAVAPPALAAMDAPARRAAAGRCIRLARFSLLLAALTGCAWLVRETAVMAEAATPGGALDALPAVISATLFGHVLLAQILAVLAALILAGFARWPALLCSGAAVVLQTWHLHAAAMSSGASLLLACELVHVLAAASWLGMLPPLLLFVAAAPAEAAFIALRRFSPVGAACVLAVAVTAFWQGFRLVGTWHALLGSAYGWMVFVKLALFMALIGLASRNRFRLAPALRGGDAGAGRMLQRSIVLESVAGAAIVLAAAVLANLPPGMDMM
jgi:putative copper resistance protein D